MLQTALLLTIAGSTLACQPVGPQPSVITFYTNQPYAAAHSQVYTNMAKTMLQQMTQRAGIPYNDNMYQVTAMNANGKAAVQVKIKQIDCVLLPTLALGAKSANPAITSVSYQCGNGATAYV